MIIDHEEIGVLRVNDGVEEDFNNQIEEVRRDWVSLAGPVLQIEGRVPATVDVQCDLGTRE